MAAVRRREGERPKKKGTGDGVITHRAAIEISDRLERALDELNLDYATFSRLSTILCPEAFAGGGEPEATAELPRTDARIDAMRARADAGLSVTIRADADLPDHAATLSKVRARNGVVGGHQVDGRQMNNGELYQRVDLRDQRIGRGRREHGERVALRRGREGS